MLGICVSIYASCFVFILCLKKNRCVFTVFKRRNKLFFETEVFFRRLDRGFFFPEGGYGGSTRLEFGLQAEIHST